MPGNSLPFRLIQSVHKEDLMVEIFYFEELIKTTRQMFSIGVRTLWHQKPTVAEKLPIS